MKRRYGLCASILIGVFGYALAENGCPAGHSPVMQGNKMACVYDYSLESWEEIYEENGVGRSATARWEDRWGAIASDGEKTYGIVTGMVSKREAESFAMAECRRRGGGICEVDRTFVNQCAAVVAGERSSASSNAPTEAQAIHMSEEICMRNGESSCRVYYSGCNFAERVK